MGGVWGAPVLRPCTIHGEAETIKAPPEGAALPMVSASWLVGRRRWLRSFGGLRMTPLIQAASSRRVGFWLFGAEGYYGVYGGGAVGWDIAGQQGGDGEDDGDTD